MARSADRHAVRCVVILPLVLATLAGCDTTQRQNVRAELVAKREIASRAPQRAGRPHPQVRVVSVTLLRRGGLPTVVVDLRSSAPRPLTDLPITVGVRSPRGGAVALNGRAGLGWFQTHVPAIPAHGAVTWVFSGRERVRISGRPFATVSAPQAGAPHSEARSLPALAASAPRVSGGRVGGVRVRVENTSRVPQYGVQVYALARFGGRYVSAGKASIAHLGTGASRTVGVPLSTRVQERLLRVHAVPTIFE